MVGEKAVDKEHHEGLKAVLNLTNGLDEASRDLIERAYRFAAQAHDGQYRLSGDPFIVHGLEVAKILAELGLDASAIAAAFLHDVVEDTGVTNKDLAREFGEEVAQLVDGMTELDKLSFLSPEEKQIESARRMLVSMVKDIRVIFIKLADRLHNMRTLEYLPEDRIRSIARETLEIYAPVAHRLGVGKIKVELEDLGFRFLEPDRFGEVEILVNGIVTDGGAVFEDFRGPIEEHLSESGIEAKITSRVKHRYGTYQKMIRKGVKVEDIYDILSMRIVTKNVRDCYHSLEIVHSLFRPIHGRFKDFIAAPKSNLYQSIHTTVMDESGRKFEIQIRTELMNKAAEYGISAHWLYKERGKAVAGWDRWLEWFKQAVDYQLELSDPSEFMKFLKTDLFQNEIYVFTPAGELKQLPSGSTPIDFAYAIHSDVGNHCTGAKVNGRLVPLDYHLKSGDRAEIMTSSKAQPHEKWLKSVKTSRARMKIRQWQRVRTKEQEEKIGRELLKSELRSRKLAFPKENQLRKLLKSFGRDTIGRLFTDLGRGKVSPNALAAKLYPKTNDREASDEIKQRERLREIVRRPIKGIKMDGMDNILVRFAQCCQPVPGDSVVGIITRGRGLSVHRVDCSNVKKFDEPGRLVSVDWDTYPGRKFLVSLIVVARDRSGLVSEISRKIGDMNTEVHSGHFEIHEGELQLVLVVSISDLKHLNRVIAEIKSIESVMNVYRAV